MIHIKINNQSNNTQIWLIQDADDLISIYEYLGEKSLFNCNTCEIAKHFQLHSMNGDANRSPVDISSFEFPPRTK